jgi:hypothetical protein
MKLSLGTFAVSMMPEYELFEGHSYGVGSPM